jgi:hypothetical protein
MNAAVPEPAFQSQTSGFDSRDCVNVVFECRGDKTVRPLRPQLLQLALAERERRARWQEEMKQSKSTDQPPEVPETKNSSQ